MSRGAAVFDKSRRDRGVPENVLPAGAHGRGLRRRGARRGCKVDGEVVWRHAAVDRRTAIGGIFNDGQAAFATIRYVIGRNTDDADVQERPTPRTKPRNLPTRNLSSPEYP
jgi:hypothetical protein